jgi:class 3 adenylate cyclase
VLTRRLSPAHLVEVLNHMFSRFDEAAARHGIEKIKTIGDCYMAATGVIGDRAGPAQIDSMAEFALEMIEVVDAVRRELSLPLGVRVGISTGAVVSGVIGTKRVNFDVWGDTVNLAIQMESTGAVGRIQVSEATYWLAPAEALPPGSAG